MNEQEQNEREQILERLRARSTLQVPMAQQSPGMLLQPEVTAQSGRSQNTVWFVVGAAGVLLMVALLLSAGGTPSGGGAASSASGALSSARLTEDDAAETVGRFYLAAFTGDVTTLEQLSDPAQLPMPSATAESLQELNRTYGTALSPSMGWRDGDFLVEVIEPDSGETISIRCKTQTSDSASARVSASIEYGGDDQGEMVFDLIPNGNSWVVEYVDGASLWEVL